MMGLRDKWLGYPNRDTAILFLPTLRAMRDLSGEAIERHFDDLEAALESDTSDNLRQEVRRLSAPGSLDAAIPLRLP